MEEHATQKGHSRTVGLDPHEAPLPGESNGDLSAELNLLKRQNAELIRNCISQESVIETYEKKLRGVEDSLSFRFGFLFSAPFRYIMDRIKGRPFVLRPRVDVPRLKNDLVLMIDKAYLIAGLEIYIEGWTVSGHGIEKIFLLDDDKVVAETSISMLRPDVARHYPMLPRSAESGFSFSLPATGGSRLTVEAHSNSGAIVSNQVELRYTSDFSTVSIEAQYAVFQKIHRLTAEQVADIRSKISEFAYQPLLSIIVPVYNVDPIWLNKCIESVQHQFYENWELCLHDDLSTSKETLACLEKWKNMDDPRIKVSFGEINENISMASNHAIAMATGEFVSLLDNDDEITPDALYEVVKALNTDAKLDLIYSDEDKLEMDDTLTGPYFKSDFNLDLLRTNNYICHFTTIRKTIGDKIGWFRAGYEGSQDHDLILRVVDQTSADRIFHIPKILYHWRKIPGSTAEVYSNKGYAYKAGMKAIADHLAYNKLPAEVGPSKRGGGVYKVTWKADESKLISIVIPFKDSVDLLKTCVESILKMTKYDRYEVILVSNNSVEKETFEYLEQICDELDFVSYHELNIDFNYSKINNWAVAQAKGDYVLFLNNDTEVITEGWLRNMAGFVQRPDVGAVGCRLLYEDRTIQHEGVVVGITGIAGHVFKGMSKDVVHHFAFGMDRNVSACTAACLLVDRTIFEAVGGFDEEKFKIAFNDIDLCLKIRKENKLIVFTPDSVLYHYESKTRGLEDTPAKMKRFRGEIANFEEKWEDVLQHDPYYNPNLSRTALDYSLNL